MGAMTFSRMRQSDYWTDKFSGPPCRTLADMTEEEIQAIEREYGCPVIRPTSKVARGSGTRSQSGRGRRRTRVETAQLAAP